MSSARQPPSPVSHIPASQARPRCWYGRSVALSPGGDPTGTGADAMPATRAARSASGPSATTGTVSPSISVEPASTAPSASDMRIRVRGGRRSRSSSAGSRITQRPRSLISGRLASASAAISSASSSAPSSVSCQRKSSRASSPNPASVSLSGAGVATALSSRPSPSMLDGPQHLDASARQLFGGRAEQAGQRVVVQVDHRRADLPQHVGQRRPYRRAAPQRQQQIGLRLQRRTCTAPSRAGSTARRRRRSGSGRHCCAAAAPAGMRVRLVPWRRAPHQ